MTSTDTNRRFPPPSGRPTLTDDEITLSYCIYFTWGYPDYVKQAFKLLQAVGAPDVPQDSNKQLTWSQLRKALESADSRDVRYLVAGNPNTPQNVLDFLAKTKDLEVVRRVAENHKAHASTLARLALHEDMSVRVAVSENASTPENVLLHLTADVNPDVRYRMAENPNMPATVLQILCADENPYVHARAKSTLQGLTHTAEVLSPDFSRLARRRIGRASIAP